MANAITTFSRAARLTGAVALLVVSAGGITPAQAHDELVSSTPGTDEVLTHAPSELELTYSGDIMDVTGANQVRVTNAAGDTVTEVEPEVDGKIVTQPLPADAADGTYTVTWRVVSSDGHPIQGTFTYSVGESTATGEASSANSAASKSASADPATEAVSGMTPGAKIGIALALVAGTIGVLVAVLAKTKKRG